MRRHGVGVDCRVRLLLNLLEISNHSDHCSNNGIGCVLKPLLPMRSALLMSTWILLCLLLKQYFIKLPSDSFSMTFHRGEPCQAPIQQQIPSTSQPLKKTRLSKSGWYLKKKNIPSTTANTLDFTNTKGAPFGDNSGAPERFEQEQTLSACFDFVVRVRAPEIFHGGETLISIEHNTCLSCLFACFDFFVVCGSIFHCDTKAMPKDICRISDALFLASIEWAFLDVHWGSNGSQFRHRQRVTRLTFNCYQEVPVT